MRGHLEEGVGGIGVGIGIGIYSGDINSELTYIPRYPSIISR